MTEPAPTLEVGEVLDAVAGTVRQYVVMTEHQADAVALWVAHTHALDAADASPYLSITSAEKESGKTRLLGGAPPSHCGPGGRRLVWAGSTRRTRAVRGAGGRGRLQGCPAAR
jgi:hypothetical protein